METRAQQVSEKLSCDSTHLDEHRPFDSSVRSQCEDKLPALSKSKTDDQPMRSADTKSKEKMKAYADNRNHAKSCTYAKRDTVLVKQQIWNKLTPAYNPKPYRITRKKGSMITASRRDHAIVRNSSFFKKLPDRAVNDRDIDPDPNDCEADEDLREHHQTVEHDPSDAELPVRPSRECRRPRYLNYSRESLNDYMLLKFNKIFNKIVIQGIPQMAVD